MTVSVRLAWQGGGTGSAVATFAQAYGGDPTTGDLGIAFAERGLGTGNMSCADDTGDGVPWVSVKKLGNTTEGVTMEMWWKVFGTVTATKRTVTVTNVTNNQPLSVGCVTYQSSVGGITWNLNGTPTSAQGGLSTSAQAGAVTLDGNPSVTVAVISTDNGAATKDAAYTLGTTITHFGDDVSSHKFTAASGSENPTYTFASAHYTMLLAAFEATPAGGFNPGWAYGATKTIGGVF